MKKFTVGVIQMDSQDNVEKNLQTAVEFIGEAAARGAKLIAMPESMNYVGTDNAGHAENIPDGPTFCLMAEQAKKHHGCTAGVSMRRMKRIPDLIMQPWLSARRENWRPNTIKYTPST